MRYTLDEQQCQNLAVSKRKEWLLTNGLGGFAMGTPAGINTRRYHGLLVAATNPPATRTVLLAGMDVFAQLGNHNPIGLSTNQYPGTLHPQGYLYLRHFHVDSEAAWIYRAGGIELEKVLSLHLNANACTIQFTNIGSERFTLTARPLVSHKYYHSNFVETHGYPQKLTFPKDKTVVEHDGVPLCLLHPRAERTIVQGWYYRFEHEEELVRGLDPRDDLYCPCELKYDLEPGASVSIVASTCDTERARPRVAPESGSAQLGQMLRDAAAQFIVKTPLRTSIIAGYPWFTDWGRDTMISLPGVLLHTGRVADARKLLLDYALAIRNGLIPNRFTEAAAADYNTADATLWFVYAVHKTLLAEWDEALARAMLPYLQQIFDHLLAGTDFGIHADEDGLLTQGEQGLQLTWMDAKIGDWVVTPRHGKPVEVNGLWINALRVMEWLCEKLRKNGSAYVEVADRAERSFEERFWHQGRGHYLDTVDPMDVSLRPNQLIAMSLPFGPAKGETGKRALKLIEQKLLTPNGVRTLAPDEADYRGRYEGPLPELDASYHQGTVWPWLLGPYCSALVRLTGDRAEAKRILRNAKAMLTERGLGGISEVYDGDEPQVAGGCPWQAWSVAEILRAWVEDAAGGE